MRLHGLVLLPALLLAAPAIRAEQPPPGKKKPAAASQQAGNKARPNVQLDLPAFGEIPKGENLQKPAEEKLGEAPRATPTATEYKVVSVTHAKAFSRGPNGSQPMGGALKEVALTGDPPTSEKFTTVVRVHCKQRMNAPIEVVILDTRGDTFMSGQGEVSFRGLKRDEADYTIDWDPTPYRSGGDFQVLVRIAGNPMGTWPLKVVSR